MYDNNKPATPVKRKPTTNDYLAGAMLANGILWIWNQALGTMPNLFSQVPPGILADITYVIYLIAAIVASNQVCTRASSKHLIVGIKSALLSWVLSLLIMLSMAPNPTVGLTLSLLLCFLAGGVVGAYLIIRSRLNN
jgi:hypothetical protein